MSITKELERIEQSEHAERLRGVPHILHPAGGLTENFVYEPIAAGEYVYKTKAGKKGIVELHVEFEDEDKEKKPHWFLEIEGERHYFMRKPPKEWLFNMPNRDTIEKWVKDEKQSLPLESLWNLNGTYLRTFLDFPHGYEFSVCQLFIQQSWLVEVLPIVFYLGVKGEFGGGKTVTGEAVVSVCRHGYLTGNLSPPFVARTIQDQKLTLMVDELDSVAGTKDSDLNSIFRQGYRRGSKYSRVNPDTLEPESYGIFGAKLFTVHANIEEALQTRTIPVHVRETGNVEYPIANLDKRGFANLVYAENFLWYMDNILSLRENQLERIEAISNQLDILDSLDLTVSDYTTELMLKNAEKIRKAMVKNKNALLLERQVSQVCQVTGRNVELMFLCLFLSNIVKTNVDTDIKETFNQKLLEEGERVELGYLGILRDMLTKLYEDKASNAAYLTEKEEVKVANKEVYDVYNERLRKEYGEGISPAKFKEYMLEFGFTDGLNRRKLEVPIPGNQEPKSRLCNIFTDRVLRKLGIEPEKPPKEPEKSFGEKLGEVKTWLMENKDAEGLVDASALAEKCAQLGLDVAKTVNILRDDYQIFEVPQIGKWGVK